MVAEDGFQGVNKVGNFLDGSDHEAGDDWTFTRVCRRIRLIAASFGPADSLIASPSLRWVKVRMV